MNTQQSAAFLKRRKFLMVMPLLVLPFLTMAFAALGGGSKPNLEPAKVSTGINLALPDANVTTLSEQDKMALYAKALEDSAKLARGMRFELPGDSSSLDGKFAAEASERAIQKKLAEINAQVNAPIAVATVSPGGSGLKPAGSAAPALSADVARLEKLMRHMQQESSTEDPETQQLNAMMDKILAIQNPELVRSKVAAAPSAPDSVFRAIPAVVAGSVKATQGSVIELRLLDTFRVAGVMIPKGHSVFGLADFSNQRIGLEIKNIRLGTSIVPVNLSVYDKRDGMRGINAPEALLSDAVGSGSVDAMGSIGLMGFDQNLGTQIASAGIGAAKGLLTKKIKRVKQKLDAGYPVLLRDNSRKVQK